MGWIGAVGALVAVSACANETDPLMVMVQERKLTEHGWQPEPSVCFEILDEDGDPQFVSSTFSTGMEPVEIDPEMRSEEFSVEHVAVPQGFRLVVSSGANRLADKVFTRGFLLKGETDRLQVTTPRGTRHEFAHRGARACEDGLDLFAE